MPRKKKTDEEPKKNKKSKEPEVGDILELTTDHKCLTMEFPKGTLVKVVGRSERGHEINNNPKNPEKGFTMIECGFEL